MPERKEKILRLFNILKPQLKKDVEILIDDRTGIPIGAKRSDLLERATGEYLNFIDDDDCVAIDYVKSIYPLLNGKNDYIGFRLQYYIDGEPIQPTYHNYEYPEWTEDEVGFYRNVTHFNPIKRSIAIQFPYLPISEGEDAEWSRRVYASGLIKTYDYIDKILYFQYYSTTENHDVLRRKYGTT